jgi:hypothetical protein
LPTSTNVEKKNIDKQNVDKRDVDMKEMPKFLPSHRIMTRRSDVYFVMPTITNTLIPTHSLSLSPSPSFSLTASLPQLHSHSEPLTLIPIASRSFYEV